ncbi:hypothetical protein [Microbacterium sp. K41]|uniref:hypothetical protein n=1 Tax=Microbacterium sp. K41 TaxID=2305437 RepID=UPI00109D06A5|nr:hypothetical protein [Microbacterium sp. K41]
MDEGGVVAEHQSGIDEIAPEGDTVPVPIVRRVVDVTSKAIPDYWAGFVLFSGPMFLPISNSLPDAHSTATPDKMSI